VIRITEEHRRWWVLIGTCAGLFLLMLDSTVVNLALPAIQRDLDASTPELQWVVNAYLLVVAALVVTAGRIGDILGRKRVFQFGMVAFVAGSAVSALAPDALALIVGRLLQGLGAAPLLSLSLAIVARAFPDEERPRALGIWAAVSGIALAIGPLVGGVLVEDASWRWIFWLNVPVGVLGFAITAAAVAESRDETASQRIDALGLVTLSGGLTGVVLGLVQAPNWGWGSPATLACLAGGVALLVAFWVVEHRVRAPIVDFALFRNGPYLGASAAGFALVGSYWGLMFYEPQYIQNVLGHSALEAGVLVLPITAPMVVLSPFSGRLERAVGVRTLMTAGMACGTAGVIVLTQVGADSGYGLSLVGYTLFGIAIGIVYAAMSTAAMEALPPAKAGIAAGVLAMVRVMAGALILAAMGAAFQHLEQEQLATEIAQRTDGVTAGEQGELDGLLAGSDSAMEALGDQPTSVVATVREAAADAFAYALGNALWILVGLLAIGTILTAALLRDPAPRAARQRVLSADALHARGRYHL